MSRSASILVFLIAVILQFASSNIVFTRSAAEQTSSTGTFSSALFNKISTKNKNQNVILSPFSIQSALTLLYMGAQNETAEELRTVLHYTSPNILLNAENISKLYNSKSEGLVQLKIANRIYSKYELVPKFNELALKYFKSEAEMVNFLDSEGTVKKINSWVEEKTNKKITNLLTPSSIDVDTSAVLVNAIYFEGKWAEQFSKYTTKKQPFWLNPSQSVEVDTMFGEITCKYGELPELDATAVELRYEDNDMALLVVLPNQRDGLKAMEKKLSNVDLTQISNKLSEEEVLVKLPKFKIEFNIGLVPILEEMGMNTSFSYGANYRGLFKSSVPVKVSNVVHKAFIDVNEYGSEAAAATYIKAVFLSSINEPKIFTADHPFVFAIKNNEATYFIGHVLKF